MARPDNWIEEYWRKNQEMHDDKETMDIVRGIFGENKRDNFDADTLLGVRKTDD